MRVQTDLNPDGKCLIRFGGIRFHTQSIWKSHSRNEAQRHCTSNGFDCDVNMMIGPAEVRVSHRETRSWGAGG